MLYLSKNFPAPSPSISYIQNMVRFVGCSLPCEVHHGLQEFHPGHAFLGKKKESKRVEMNVKYCKMIGYPKLLNLGFVWFLAKSWINMKQPLKFCISLFPNFQRFFSPDWGLFKGVPVWTPINRPADSHLSRERYLQRFQPLEEEQTLRSTIVTLGASKNQNGALFPARMGDDPVDLVEVFPVFFSLKISRKQLDPAKIGDFKVSPRIKRAFRQPLDGFLKGIYCGR